MLGYYHLFFIGLPFGIRNALILKTTMSSYTLDGDKELDNNNIPSNLRADLTEYYLSVVFGRVFPCKTQVYFA